MNNQFYHCTVCEQFLTEEEIIRVQNTSSIRKAWRECPVCGSKVLPVAYKNFDGQDMMEDLFHRTAIGLNSTDPMGLNTKSAMGLY